jgi:ankyrin repeat protein
MLKHVTALLLVSLSFIGCSGPSQSNQNASAPATAGTPAKDPDGNTPLLLAVNKGDTEEVRHLIEAGADVNAANNAGVTPLMNAGGMGNKEAVELLIQKGADVNHRTSGNYTPLMQAALVGQLEIVKILLDAGADPTVKDTGGRTAMDYAEERDRKDIGDLLKARTPPASTGRK